MINRVGIIFDSLLVSKHVYNLIELSHTSKHYKITTILLNDVQKKN